MSRTRVLLTIGYLLVANTTFAAEELSLEDRLLITDALTQYSYRWDSKDAAGFSRLFLEDGEMERWASGSLVEGSLVRGREAIYQYGVQAHQGRLADRQTRHHFSGLVFKVIDSVTVETENMALITHQTSGVAPFISGSGIYRITWKKTDDGWLMAKRILFSDRVE